MKQLPFPVLKVCPCVGMSLCSLHVPSGFGGRTGSEMSMGCVFTWGVLAATTLMGGRAGDGGARAGARCELELLLCSVAITTLSGGGIGDIGVGAGPLRELDFSQV